MANNMSSAIDEEATISIPSLAFVAVLGYFIYRYFFSAPRGGADGNSSSSSRNPGLRFTPAQVDQIAQMFPQLSRRDIMWDLHRNRGSVQATTERVLSGRGLEPVSDFIRLDNYTIPERLTSEVSFVRPHHLSNRHQHSRRHRLSRQPQRRHRQQSLPPLYHPI